MSKDILTALITILVGLIIWWVTDLWHEQRSNTLLPNLTNYLETVDPTLDTKTLEQLQLDRGYVGG